MTTLVEESRSDHDKIMSRALDQWGFEGQITKTFEECSELKNALRRYKRGEAKDKEVITEVADVMIMASQLAYYFGDKKVKKEISKKLRRVERRLNKPPDSTFK